MTSPTPTPHQAGCSSSTSGPTAELPADLQGPQAARHEADPSILTDHAVEASSLVSSAPLDDGMLPQVNGAPSAPQPTTDGAPLGATPNSSLSTPNSVDWSLIAALPAAARSEFRLLWSYASRIAGQPRLLNRCKAIAAEVNLPWQTVYRRVRQYSLTGDWRQLLDQRHTPALWHTRERTALPEAFKEHVREQIERNQRKAKPAIRGIIRQWQRWYAGDKTARLPGYDTCPAPAPGLYPPRPAGWSDANLYRLCSSKFQLLAARQGLEAAKPHGPIFLTTRRNLWVGSHYLFDDIWHDHFTNLLDTQKTGRPLEFHALDLASACKIGWGFYLRTEDDLTGKMKGLSEAGMRFLLVSVLMRHGYHPTRGTTLVVENGTAAINEDLEKLLLEIIGDKITIQRAPMVGDPAFTGLYGGRAKGNFRIKAALESHGNLTHNELATIRGQTGLSRDNRPDDTHGLLKTNDALLNAIVALPEDRRMRLKFEVMEFTDFQSIANELYQHINSRTQHNLEGWESRTLPVNLNGQLIVRRMSPAEVWTDGRRQLVPIQPHQAALILYRDWLAITRKVQRHRVEFLEREISPDPLRYDCHTLVDGEKYDCILNPFMPDRLWIFDAKGRFVRTCPRVMAADRADVESVKQQFREVMAARNALLAPVSKRGHRLRQDAIKTMRRQIEALTDPSAAPAPDPETVDADNILDRAARSFENQTEPNN